MQGKKTLLITGVSGLLGSNLAVWFKDRYEVIGTYNKRECVLEGVCAEQCDLLQPDAVRSLIEKHDPRIVIHGAALADVDACEQDRDLAHKSNVEATGILVEAIKGRSAKLIHLSSDSIFDGKKEGCYTEEDPPCPINFYGETKRDAERMALRHKEAIVARTNIFGWDLVKKRSLSEWAINALTRKEKINGFADVFFSSIYTLDLAALFERAVVKNIKGVYNFASSSSMSKYEFLLALARKFHLEERLIKPVKVDEHGLPAQRAKNLVLDVSKLKKDLEAHIPTMEECIDHYYSDAKEGWPRKIQEKSSVA